MSDLVARVRHRLGSLVRRIRGRVEDVPDRDRDGEIADPAPLPEPWPVPQLGPGGAGVLRVAAPATELGEDEVRAHPNRLAGDWAAVVVDTSAVREPGPWAGAFTAGGCATGDALELVTAGVPTTVQWDVAADELRVAGIDVRRLDALGERS